MNPNIDKYIEKKAKWRNELIKLRNMLNKTELVESIKWGAPTYSLNNKNVVGISAFKNHYGLWFFNGVFLKDEMGLLINAQKSTKAMRQLRFEKDSTLDLKVVEQYVLEAIENQKKGLEVKPERSKKIEIPSLLKSKLEQNQVLHTAFNKLSFGKQKEYAKYISDAKLEKTKISRMAKIEPMILQNIGLNDKYRNC